MHTDKTIIGTDMKVGDKFTIAGHMKGRKGQLVINGVNPETKRKCKGVAPYVFRVSSVYEGPKHG